MLLNVEDLTEDQLKKIGLPPNPAGWNCFDTETKQYSDAFWVSIDEIRAAAVERVKKSGIFQWPKGD